MAFLDDNYLTRITEDEEPFWSILGYLGHGSRGIDQGGCRALLRMAGEEL